MGASDDAVLRARLAKLLHGGLQTDWQQRAYTSEDVNRVVARLQAVAPTDYEAKLKIAGVTAQPYRPLEDSELEQCCATCMYFERNRQFCDLPELAIPVEEQWSCVLWRI